MVDKHLIKAWRFFLDNAGYCTPPGRVVCAMDMAKAEKQAWDNDWQVGWEYDPDADLTCDCGKDHGPAMVAILRDSGGNVLASLGGITGVEYDNGYRRVIAAELAVEAMSNGC